MRTTSLARRLLLAAAVPLLHVETAIADPVSAAEVAVVQRDGRHDFDFLIGDWTVRLRKLLKPLTGSTTWIEYRGTSRTRKIWGELANTEEFDVEGPPPLPPIRAQTLRLYNPDSRQWSIYLVNAAKGVLSLPPVVGQFTGGVGEFVDHEEFGGRWILVRYVWSDITPLSATMTQSFSADGGRSWEPNWICELSR
jgi:hypothetical protein